MTITEYNYCVKEFADHLYRFARKSIGDEDEAKDAVQQAFLVLWEKREDVIYLKAKSFLFTIAYRRSMDFHRNHKQLIDPELLSNVLQIEDRKTTDLKGILHQALLKISNQGRTLVLLKDYEGYNYEEIAELTQLNITQVKVYLHRARKELKTYLVSSGNNLKCAFFIYYKEKIMDVNAENIEELILLSIDEELSQEETLSLMDFLKKNPEYSQLLECYSITKFIPEDNIEYPEKNQLLRPESKRLVFYKRTKIMLGGVGALVLMVLGIALIWLQKPKQNIENLVLETKNSSVPIKTQLNKATNSTSKAISNQTNALLGATVHKQQNKTIAKNTKPHFDPDNNENNIGEFAVSPLQPQGIKLLDIDENVVEIKPIKMPQELIAMDQSQKKATEEKKIIPYIEWTSEMSFDENRLKGIVSLINQVQETHLKVAENIAILKKSTIVLQLGNKEIALNKQN